MYFKNNELTILYNGNHYKSKQTLAVAKTIVRKVNQQNIVSTRVSVNLFCSLLSKMGASPKELVNRAHLYYQSELRNRELSDEEWFYVLMLNSFLFVNPIVFYNNKGIICYTPTDALKLN